MSQEYIHLKIPKEYPPRVYIDALQYRMDELVTFMQEWRRDNE